MKLLAILAMVLTGVVCLLAQVPITNGVVSIDFNNFLGQGFSPTPAAGQLDSDDWAVTGLSDGELAFGDTMITGDFARGVKPGKVTTGGIYAFEVSTEDYALGVQPGTSDFTSGSFILRLINNTGSAISQINLQYDLYVMNDQPRSNYFNSLYSTDSVNYTPLTQLDYTSPAAADPSPTWQKITRMATITGLNISDGDYFYIKWESDDVSGSGYRDEFALDNILLSPGDTPLPVSLLSFTARSGADGILLNWETASEMENAGFEIYRRFEASDHEVLLASYQWMPELAGQGNTHLHYTYSYLDRQVSPGQCYVYVLADVDFSGKRHRHPALTVNYTRNGDSENLAVPDFEVLPNYPNPFNPETTIPVIIHNPTATYLYWQIFDISGRVVDENKINVNGPGKIEIHWRAGNRVAAGIYYARVTCLNQVKNIKLLLTK